MLPANVGFEAMTRQSRVGVEPAKATLTTQAPTARIMVVATKCTN